MPLTGGVRQHKESVILDAHCTAVSEGGRKLKGLLVRAVWCVDLALCSATPLAVDHVGPPGAVVLEVVSCEIDPQWQLVGNSDAVPPRAVPTLGQAGDGSEQRS